MLGYFGLLCVVVFRLLVVCFVFVVFVTAGEARPGLRTPPESVAHPSLEQVLPLGPLALACSSPQGGTPEE